MIPTDPGLSLQDLARPLLKALDTNQDGQLNMEEFTRFLNRFAGDPPGAALGDAPGDAGPITSPFKDGPAPVMAGFDSANMRDPNMQTVKYMFARVAQNYSLSSVHDMASAEAMLRDMRPELEAAGITVLDVGRDKIQVLDDSGQEAWVDVIRGAGAHDPAFQWHDTRFA